MNTGSREEGGVEVRVSPLLVVVALSLILLPLSPVPPPPLSRKRRSQKQRPNRNVHWTRHLLDTRGAGAGREAVRSAVPESTIPTRLLGPRSPTSQPPGLAIIRRWLSPSGITLAFQRYFKYRAVEPQHTLSVRSSMALLGAATFCKISRGRLWGECLPGACVTFVLCILSLAPSLSSPREVPQVDRTRPQTFRAKHVA